MFFKKLYFIYFHGNRQRRERRTLRGNNNKKGNTLVTGDSILTGELLKNMENMGVFYQNMGGNMGNTTIKGNMGVVGALHI